ncbi:hypothetical protein PVAND_001570 [Polypedilum vanderplanki]|uniref:Uncharacterized protein n=1 Tax=Polypedilum vanderplanki TaxID=319348 RepID=A0A9J6BNB9_POLVA|nr:hypothetical protein PVAND_001570 [Polypedilum vanderplanki]
MNFKENIIKIFLFFLLVISVDASHHRSHHRRSHERKYVYPCANRFYRYYLDDEPAEYGLSAGHYAPGKKAYVGVSAWRGTTLISGRLQFDPPGVMLAAMDLSSVFVNNTKQVWYLNKRSHHDYDWVVPQNGTIDPFAIDIGGASGLPTYIIRVKSNKTVSIGFFLKYTGVASFVDENNVMRMTMTGFEILTCKSSKNDTPIPPPKLTMPDGSTPPPNVDSPSGCINKWLPYNNDDAPAKNGIAAGEYDCGNTAYVGKGTPYTLVSSGRIQITPNSGFYIINARKELYMANGSYYLADNPNYTYRWESFDGTLPINTVYARNDFGNFAFPIPRIQVNGRMTIGRVLFPLANVPDADLGYDVTYSDYEFLVCDPWPKYQCSHQWKQLSANGSNPAVDGFLVNSVTFIGRTSCNDLNRCDYGIGQIQQGVSGLNYLDDLGNVIFDNSSNVEYLLKNSNNFYKWTPSKYGAKVANALKLQKGGNDPFYIGMTRMLGITVVGKVDPGEGLSFIDPFTNKLKKVSAYSVLTCTSSDISNGIYDESTDVNWSKNLKFE